MNEELASTNQELQAMNDELHQRTGELDRTNAYLESILGSVDVGVAVIDKEFQILLWNERAADLWGLRSDEVVGRSLFTLDIGLPVHDLKTPIQETWLRGNLTGDKMMLDATNRRGKAIEIQVTRFLHEAVETGPQYMVLLMEEEKA